MCLICLLDFEFILRARYVAHRTRHIGNFPPLHIEASDILKTFFADYMLPHTHFGLDETDPRWQVKEHLRSISTMYEECKPSTTRTARMTTYW